jgi:hypothetical protein
MDSKAIMGYWYDRNVQMWAVAEIDADGYCIGREESQWYPASVIKSQVAQLVTAGHAVRKLAPGSTGSRRGQKW